VFESVLELIIDMLVSGMMRCRDELRTICGTRCGDCVSAFAARSKEE